MATPAQWIQGARPKTLGAGFAPVAAGTGAALAAAGFQSGVTIPRALLALGLALAMQIGGNFSNDYSDGIRGTDSGERVGPLRLTASGLAEPRHVKHAAFASYGIGMLLGLILCAVSGTWWLAVVGVACVAAGWFYVGGRRPYGYRGFGEIMVLIFFGFVPVLGTVYTQIGAVTGVSALAALGVGLLAVALLTVNNLRDLDSDRAAGKITLAVILGDARTRWLFAACLTVPFACAAAMSPAAPWALLAVLAAPLVAGPLRIVLRDRATGRPLIGALHGTNRSQLAYGLLLLVGLALS